MQLRVLAFWRDEGRTITALELREARLRVGLPTKARLEGQATMLMRWEDDGGAVEF